MDQEQIDIIIKEHAVWLKDRRKGKYANFREKDLKYAFLSGAILSSASMCGADLRFSNLKFANLRNANLERASLTGANFTGANLTGATLSNTSLRGVYFRQTVLDKVDLRGAFLPSPTSMLLAQWGILSDKLTTELMRYDAANHPEGSKAFTKWVQGGPCPYDNCTVNRAANFREWKECWSRGKAKSAYKLLLMLFKEKEVLY